MGKFLKACAGDFLSDKDWIVNQADIGKLLADDKDMARILTGHPLLLHVCAIAYTCKSNCLFMYKQQTQHVMLGRTGKEDKQRDTVGGKAE